MYTILKLMCLCIYVFCMYKHGFCNFMNDNSYSQYVLQRILESTKESKTSIVHYVETKPSSLRDVLEVQEHDVCNILQV